MKDLYISKYDSDEKNVLAIIDYVKQIEREHGLSDEEIKYKYTMGCCARLAWTIRFLFREVMGKTIFQQNFNTVSGEFHVYIRLNKDSFYDINGKSSLEQVYELVNSDYFEKQAKKTEFTHVQKTFEETYMEDECYKHIKLKEPDKYK